MNIKCYTTMGTADKSYPAYKSWKALKKFLNMRCKIYPCYAIKTHKGMLHN